MSIGAIMPTSLPGMKNLAVGQKAMSSTPPSLLVPAGSKPFTAPGFIACGAF